MNRSIQQIVTKYNVEWRQICDHFAKSMENILIAHKELHPGRDNKGTVVCCSIDFSHQASRSSLHYDILEEIRSLFSFLVRDHLIERLSSLIEREIVPLIQTQVKMKTNGISVCLVTERCLSLFNQFFHHVSRVNK